jgi:hypothetical protein
MDFRIADIFTDSLARLTGAEQKAVKTTAFDLQLDPTSAGLHFHRLDRARDPNFWSVRVNADVRLIVHKTATSVLLCLSGITTRRIAGRSGAGSNDIRQPALLNWSSCRNGLRPQWTRGSSPRLT